MTELDPSVDSSGRQQTRIGRILSYPVEATPKTQNPTLNIPIQGRNCTYNFARVTAVNRRVCSEYEAVRDPMNITAPTRRLIKTYIRPISAYTVT